MSVAILKQLFKEKNKQMKEEEKNRTTREATRIQDDLRWRGVMRQNVSDPTATAPPEDRPCKKV